MTTSRRTFSWLVFLFLGLLSALICIAVVPDLSTAIRQLSWHRSECIIEESAAVDIDGSIDIRVRYHYSHNGTPFSGNRFRLPGNSSPSRSTLRAEAARYTSGISVECWIDPNDPATSVLQRHSFASAIILILPGMFIVGLVAFMRNRFGARRINSVDPAPRTHSNHRPSLAPYAFFGLFIVVGLLLTYVFFWTRYSAIIRSHDWLEDRCTILESGTQSHSSEDSKGRSSTSWSVRVRYSYSVEGKNYVGTTYNPSELTTSDYESVSRTVSTLGVGESITCYRNPQNVFETTIDRSVPHEVWFGLFPLIFTVAGLLGAMFLAQQRAAAGSKVRGGRTSRRARSRVGGFVGLILLNIVWNGIVGVGCYAFLGNFELDLDAVFPLIVLLPFALIGSLLILLIPYSFLQIFNPGLNLECSPTVPTAGSNFRLWWTVTRRTRRVRHLKILLELVEETRTAAAGRSSSPIVSTKTIHTITVVDTNSLERIAQGKAEVQIPSESELLSVEGSRKWRITWNLAIPWYPDSSDIIDLVTDQSE